MARWWSGGWFIRMGSEAQKREGPMTNDQGPNKSQNPRLARSLGFGVWIFFGNWTFVIGHSQGTGCPGYPFGMGCRGFVPGCAALCRLRFQNSLRVWRRGGTWTGVDEVDRV